MGNVQQKGREDSLSQFQRRKLKYDFYTFFGKQQKAYLCITLTNSIFFFLSLSFLGTKTIKYTILYECIKSDERNLIFMQG
jgi:hypothetical protein